MPSQQNVVDILDLVSDPAPQELPNPDAQQSLLQFQQIIASENVIGLGAALKVRRGRTIPELSMVIYVHQKLPLWKIRPAERVPIWVPSKLSPNTPIMTDVIELGEITPQPAVITHLDNRTGRITPGCSVSRLDANPGTLGAIVKIDGSLAILSNSHILARSGKGKLGDGILLPGRLDGGIVPNSLIGTLAAFKPFIEGGAFVNDVDCAVALLRLTVIGKVSPTIVGIGLPKGIIQPTRGMKVIKLGRTTGLTNGTVLDTNFRLSMKYEGVGLVGFKDQVLCTPYSQGGDSGSLIIDMKSKAAVGLHFAGSIKGSIFCPINKVLTSLGVSLVTS